MTGKAETAKTGRNVRMEGMIQIVVMLAIGAAAGAASFTHVHNVAAAHGQAGWLAWADAVVLELMSITSGLELRHRKRHGKSARMPAAVLVVSVVLSLSAQVVEAEQSFIGWIAAALPAAGFLVMVKFALGHAVTVSSDPEAAPAAVNPSTRENTAESHYDPMVHGADDGSPDHGPAVPDEARTGPEPRSLAPVQRTSRTELETTARAIHEEVTAAGARLTRRVLADRLRETGKPVSNAMVGELVRLMNNTKETQALAGERRLTHTLMPVKD